MGVTTKESRNIFYVKLKGTKQKESPQFIVTDADTKEEVATGNELSGIIKDIRPHTYEYQGDTVRGFKMELEDADGSYLAGFSYTMFSRTILNCLSTVTLPGVMKINVKPAGDADDGYPKIFLSMDEITLKWKYKFAELNEKVVRDGKNADYSALDSFMDQIITEILAPMFSEAYPKLKAQGFVAPAALTQDRDEVLDAAPAPEEKEPTGDIYAKDIDSAGEIPTEVAPAPTMESVRKKATEPPVSEDENGLPF